MHALVGRKTEQTQKFLTDGTRIPVTVVVTADNHVVAVKTKGKDGYNALQLGFGTKKNAGKSLLGHAKKAQLDKAPSFLKEVRLSDKQAETVPQLGEVIEAAAVFEPGDIVDVMGFSKGKGFAGGVKRYHFRGGPKTHGQSDRHRAPGSIGSGTTPGRVYKGKRMAGKMGNENVTLKNLEVVEVGNGFIWIKGVIPGVLGAMVTIEATGKKDKKFPGILKAEEVKTEEALESPEGTSFTEAAETAPEEEAKEVVSEAVEPVAEEQKTEEVKTEEAPVEEAKEGSEKEEEVK